MNVPELLKYSADHEWVSVDGAIATIGITDYAQDALGDVVFVDVPEIGANVESGATFSEVESTKSVSDIFAPVSGEIVAVNQQLDDNPELLNSDPYGEGWICRITMSDQSQLGDLIDAAAYQALIEG